MSHAVVKELLSLPNPSMNAAYATKELEETAKLFLLLRGSGFNSLTAEQVVHLQNTVPR